MGRLKKVVDRLILTGLIFLLFGCSILVSNWAFSQSSPSANSLLSAYQNYISSPSTISATAQTADTVATPVQPVKVVYITNSSDLAAAYKNFIIVSPVSPEINSAPRVATKKISSTD